MKISNNILMTAAIFFFSSMLNFAQTSLFNTTAKFVKSEAAADSFYILVSVPDGYYSNEKNYPVLYVLDGDIAFGMAASIARYLQIGDNIPELIVVGIGYGAIDKSAGEKRRRDYRPDKSGGAEKFLMFIKDELIPYIDSNFRTIPDNRTITGYSIGGLFALYALFTQPDIFNRYIVGSPSLSWDNYSIFGYEESSVDKLKEKSLNVFISVGSEESDEKYFNQIDKMVTQFQERDYPGVKLEAKVFDGSTHLMGPPESLTHGLLSVFGKD
ncbi:MAG TPA: alpha/beta hydrolase-fold protein [Ignavibacteriaceae bacterium]|nr:alpha/beta hydrolase-fold protein [Ignavibacteriaceae bacterium]